MSLYVDLGKKDKKIARQLIDKGLMIEYSNALVAAEKILQKWRAGDSESSVAYMELYKGIHYHDQGIARRYNGLGGSRYLITVAGLFAEKIITEEDIREFSEEIQQVLQHFAKR